MPLFYMYRFMRYSDLSRFVINFGRVDDPLTTLFFGVGGGGGGNLSNLYFLRVFLELVY